MDWVTAILLAIAQAETRPFWIAIVVMSLLGAGGFVYGWVQLQRARLIENTPTSRIRSAAQGYVELQGHSRLMPGPEIRAPLSGERCCWWDFRVEQKQREYRNGSARTEWKVIERGTSDELFLLADGTGECVIDPVGARVIPSVSRRWRGSVRRPQSYPAERSWFEFGDFRYRERLVRYGDWLYALGEFRSQTAVRHDQESQDVSDLLAQWKRDRAGLLRRFDADGDGEISVKEWQLARAAAVKQVRAEQVERSVQPARGTVSERSEVGADAGRTGASRTHLPMQGTVSAPDLHVLGRPDDRRRPYILSTQSERQLTRGLRWTGLASLCVAVLLGAATTFALLARGVL